MSNQVSWKIDTKELDRILANSDVTRDKIIRKIAFEIEGDAKQNAPYETTALRNSIYTVTSKEDNYGKASGEAQEKRMGVQTEPHPKPGEGEARVGPCVDYGAYQEFGTSRMAAQPYLIPAFEKARSKFEDGTTFRELCE